MCPELAVLELVVLVPSAPLVHSCGKDPVAEAKYPSYLRATKGLTNDALNNLYTALSERDVSGVQRNIPV